MPSHLPRFTDDRKIETIPTTGLRGQYGPYIADPGLVHAARTALGLDMPLLLYDFTDVVAYGGSHSTVVSPLGCCGGTRKSDECAIGAKKPSGLSRPMATRSSEFGRGASR